MRAVLMRSALAGLFVAAALPSAFAQRDPKAPACVFMDLGGAGIDAPGVRGMAGVRGSAASGATVDPAAENFWTGVARGVALALGSRLQREGYEVFEPLPEAGGRWPKTSFLAISRSGCAELLQLGHDVGEDADGPYFTFRLSLRRLEGTDGGPPRQGAPVHTVALFDKTYRHPHTREGMRAFSRDGEAIVMATELRLSGQIESARTGTARP